MTSSPDRSWKDNVKHSWSSIQDILRPTTQSYSQISNEAKTSLTIAGTVFVTIIALRTHKRYFRRIPTAEHIQPQDVGSKLWIKGVVTSVGDADNFRLYHTPGFGWKWPLKFRSVPTTTKELTGQTIHIRMAGIDAPEGAHFGHPAQPYADEALAWLRKTVFGKEVWCQILLRDQYMRVVAIPLIKSRIPFRYNCVSLMMLKAGWATVYDQSGAKYGKWGKKHFLSVLTKAQKAKRGMWEHGTNGETPAEYKKRYAATGTTTRS